jgi:hypothetical protein
MSDASGLIRPFVMTGGRTRPTLELRLETQLVTIQDPSTAAHSDEHHAVLTLCLTPQSLAEVSAKLGLALGVTKVIVADLLTGRMLKADNAGAGSGTGDREVLSRVLERLVAL